METKTKKTCTAATVQANNEAETLQDNCTSNQTNRQANRISASEKNLLDTILSMIIDISARAEVVKETIGAIRADYSDYTDKDDMRKVVIMLDPLYEYASLSNDLAGDLESFFMKLQKDLCK